jgi:hypothetical protein
MKEKSRIRFNPGTKEIEIEGSEEFVKAYFNKLQNMISGAPLETVEASAKKPKMAEPRAAKRDGKPEKKASGRKKVANIDTVVTFIQGAPEGISTAALKEKTGLTERQIWSIVDRAAKLGKIKKMKRGVYGAS